MARLIDVNKVIDSMKTIFAPTEKERTVTGMAKYIDREALIEWLKRIPLIDLSDGRGLCRVVMEDDFKNAIKKMPKCIIADVATVRHGRLEYCRCSNCKEEAVSTSWDEPIWEYDWEENLRYSNTETHTEYHLTNYCPNCGAKMDLEVNNDA